MCPFKFITFVSLSCLFAEAARILVVIPTPSISHQVVFRPLTQELARRGHEVVVITADPAFPKGQTPENLTEIDVHDISYAAWKETLFTTATQGKSDDIMDQLGILLTLLSKVFERQMMTDDVQSVIRNTSNHFDLLMIEACVRPAVSLSYLFKVPMILISSLGAVGNQFDLVGAPSRPVLLFPTMFRQRLTNLSIWEKLNELYNHYYFKSIFESQLDEDDRIVKRLFGPDTPSTKELGSNMAMLFLNVHPIWEFNRPVPPNVIFMGGLHQKPSKELPKDLKTYLDSSKNGVIYISFGTNVSPSQLPPEKIQVLVKTFSDLPYDVLWKWDKDELPNRSKNIRISKWLPQSDLLKHPKIKLFITQGGLQSTDESITAGVPLIGMPMLGDQWFNVEQYVYRKIGIRLDMETLTVEKLKNGINTIVMDDSYRKNIVKLRTIMNDQPQTSLDRAVWWTEHVIRHRGASHLKAHTANMPWSEYLDLELLAFLGLSALAVLITLGFVLHFLYSFLRQMFFSNGKMKKS